MVVSFGLLPEWHPSVRLRLARPRDAAAISALFEAQGLAPEELEIARLVRFDPRSRFVICATSLIDSRERVVAVGSIELDARSPERVVASEPELAQLLARVLTDRAARAAARAA